METTNANEVGVSGTTEEFPESTVEINVKTLDSQTYTLRVNKYVPVPALKEQIANLTGILSGQQRLICRGKVLKDDQLLSAYHVEDGHTLHLVVRQPQSQTIPSSVRLDDIPSHPGSNSGLNPMHNPLGHNVVLGAVNLADPGDAGTSDFNQVFSALFNSLGLTNIGMASERLDSRDVNYGRLERTAGSGVSATPQSEASLGVGRADISPHQSAFGPQSVHYLGQQHPTVIPDSLTTLSQFLSHVRHQFDIRDHLLGDADRQHSARAEGGRTQHVGGHNDASPFNLSPEQRGLPTPACLAEILLSTRQLFTERVGECFYELAKELEDQANVTDPLARSMIQSRAVRYGTLFQNFGSLFLELGRTVMTLRMGQTPSEAVVNAGPAIFVSSTGATPLMVQAGTSFGGIPMGNQQPGGLPHGSGLLAGNINIRIHRGPSVPVATENVSGQPTEEQPSGTADPPRTPAENLAHQVFQGLLSNASIPQESGPRVVPLRTVVAVPAGVSRPPPPDSSGGAVGLLYPLYAGFHQRIPGTLDDARISQVSLRPTAQPQTPDSITRGHSAASTPPSGQVTSPINGEQAPEGEQGSAAQDPVTPFGEEAQGGVGGDGLFFSSLVRQLMPFISENASEAGGSSSSGRDPSSSPRRSNLPEEPEPKRRKRE